jgi:hypothetical protein
MTNMFSLLDELAAGGGRPGTCRARLIADRKPLCRVFVRPDVDPLVEPAELGVAAEGERRQIPAPSIRLGPFFDDGRRRTRQHRVGTNP